MDSKELKLVSQKAECLHSSALIQTPDGLKSYGLPVDTDDCMQCAWRDFEQSVGKRVELPSMQIFWWNYSDDKEPHWVAEIMPLDLLPDVASIVGRGETPGKAIRDMSRQLRTFLSQHQ